MCEYHNEVFFIRRAIFEIRKVDKFNQSAETRHYVTNIRARLLWVRDITPPKERFARRAEESFMGTLNKLLSTTVDTVDTWFTHYTKQSMSIKFNLIHSSTIMFSYFQTFSKILLIGIPIYKIKIFHNIVFKLNYLYSVNIILFISW